MDLKNQQFTNLFTWCFNIISSISFSPNAKIVAFGCSNSFIYICSTRSGKLKQQLRDYNQNLCSVVFSPNGQMIASGGKDLILLWDVSTGKNIQILNGHHDGIQTISFSLDGTLIASAGFNLSINLWKIDQDLQVNEKIKKFNFLLSEQVGTKKLNNPPQIAISVANQILVTSIDQSINLWDLAGQRKISKLCDHSCTVSSLCITNGCKLVVAGAENSNIYVWDLISFNLKSI